MFVNNQEERVTDDEIHNNCTWNAHYSISRCKNLNSKNLNKKS